MSDVIKQVRLSLVEAISPLVDVYDSFSPQVTAEQLAVITQMRAVRAADSSCCYRWEVTADIDVYQDFKSRGGNSALDDMSESIMYAIDVLDGYFDIKLNSTGTNGLRVLDRTMYRRNINYTFMI